MATWNLTTDIAKEVFIIVNERTLLLQSENDSVTPCMQFKPTRPADPTPFEHHCMPSLIFFLFFRGLVQKFE